MTGRATRDEFLACVLARQIEGLGNVAVGTNSPVAATAALLVQAESPATDDLRGRLSSMAYITRPKTPPEGFMEY